ncbi:MAG: hypothetical protein KBS80_07695 [Bacteroidales bacterium]|nr:hypothetical protein [Candidatus Cryptobacteroides choladohippi]
MSQSLLRILTVFCALVFPFFTNSASSLPDRDLELVRSRFATAALDPSGPIDYERVAQRMADLSPDGSWPDINYVDTRNVAFQNHEHLRHVVEMARAYKMKGSPLKGRKELKRKLLLAIDYWTANDFICANWWYNQIDTPDHMIKLLYIMDGELGGERTAKMVEIALRANMQACGARPSGDRIKIASLYTKTRLWQRDENEVRRMLDIICTEMDYYTEEKLAQLSRENPAYFTPGKGLRPDFSFHHRDDGIDNTLGYGISFASSFMEWAVNLQGTRYAFGSEYTDLMVDYYLDGICKHMAFGVQYDPGIMNREISRPGSGGKVSDCSIPKALIGLTDYRRDDLQAIIDLREGRDVVPASYAKMFYNSEYFVFQRPGWFASVRMHSSRNASMEYPHNSEGITNHYRGDGANHLTVTGGEYADIYPTFDFRKVPGVTTVQAGAMPPEDAVQQRGLTDFVGGVDDGLYGAAAFDFISALDVVSARKAWFFFDGCYVCLGAGIAHFGPQDVTTTVNQCFLDGDVAVSSKGFCGVLPQGERMLENVSWVNHAGVGYVFPGGAKAGILNKPVEGSWKQVNLQSHIREKGPVVNDIFCLYLDHGEDFGDGRYAYIVVPGADAEQTADFASHNGILVLSNTRILQAVMDAGAGIAYAVMYAGGELRLSDSLSIASETPVMLLVRFDASTGAVTELVASDPSRNCSALHLTVRSAGSSRCFDVVLPKGELGGSSVQLW